MARKAELQKEARKLGIDTYGMKVADLEAALAHVETAVEEASHIPEDAAAAVDAPVVPAPASKGRHAVHAVGSSQGVHIQLGHLVDDGSGTMVFQFASDWVVGFEEALGLVDELGVAAAAHHAEVRSLA